MTAPNINPNGTVLLVVLIDPVTGLPYSSSGMTLNFDSQFAAPNGGAADGVTDNSASMNAAIAYLLAFPSAVVGHVIKLPSLWLGAGVYKFGSAWSNITFPGFDLHGQGDGATALLWNGVDGLMNIGVRNLAPATYYPVTNGQHYKVSDLTCYSDTSAGNMAAIAGARTPIFIADYGSGGCVLNNVKGSNLRVFHAGYYGMDFIKWTGSTCAENCDIGLYAGPGSQQIEINSCGDFGTFYSCREGSLIEQAGSIEFASARFINCGVFGAADHSGGPVTIENRDAGSTTRLGVTILANPVMNAQRCFDKCWFESNAGGLGFLPLYFIRFTGDAAADAVRGLLITDATIVSGGAAPGGAAFIGNSMTGAAAPGGGVGPRNLRVVRPFIQAGSAYFASWFTGCNGLTYDTLIQANGAALIPIDGGTGINYWDEAVATAGAIPAAGFAPRGKFWHNVLAGPVAAGVWTAGWRRLTDGTRAGATWVAGTDVTVVIEHNT